MTTKMAKTVMVTRAAATKTATKQVKTNTKTGGGGGSGHPDDPEESDDNASLYPSSGGDDGDDDSGSDDNNSDEELLYDYHYMERADMVTLFKRLGFSEAAAKQVVRYEQIDEMDALTELTDERCKTLSRTSGRCT